MNSPASPAEILGRPVQYLKGVGPARARNLARLGIATVRDLIEHAPRDYRFFDRVKTRVFDLLPGEQETMRGRVAAVLERRPRRGLLLVQVMVDDGAGSMLEGVWFNQPGMARILKPGQPVLLAGAVQRRGGRLQMQNPEWEVLDTEGPGAPLHAGRIAPVYPLTKGLYPREMRRIVHAALGAAAAAMPDPVPAALRRRLDLLPAAAAWTALHFPAAEAELAQARRTLAFAELFVLQTGIALLRSRRTTGQGVRHRPPGDLVRRLSAALPFALTAAQRRVVAEVSRDMQSARPMNRLVQGDVGSGKTVVAALALALAVDSGFQGALMAPTEILAEQHFLGLRRLFEPLGVQVVALAGKQPRKQRQAVLDAVRTGAAHIAVGTHALIQEEVAFCNLSLVVTDEQHRFGVRQRAELALKGQSPDVLVMTATPIPRTLALTLYGDLDVSVIDELPPGRRPVETYWRTEADRDKVYAFLAREVAAGRQGYVICPLVEESDKLQAEAAVQWHQKLQAAYPGVRFGLLHGRMRTQEKEHAMAEFRQGRTEVLVATTVVEVGVDVPQASVIVIEGADRFGLAALHQLRGRVGRGEHRSFCILIADADGEARERMMVLQKTSDGFAIAEKDLQLRGPGEFFGTRQHGLPDFKVANPVRDLPLLETARQAALDLVERDPRLGCPEHRVLYDEVYRRLGERLGLIQVS